MAEPETEPAETHDAPEAIHLPPPSIWPVVCAIGIALLLTGLILTPVTVILGALITVVSIVAWIRDSRRELSGLPEWGRHLIVRRAAQFWLRGARKGS